MADDAKQRRRMLGRLRHFLTQRRAPRTILSVILMLTALAGFLASAGLLKLGLGTMWLRYPLAVLAAWGVFLVMVRLWAERERGEVQAEEDLTGLGPRDDVFDGGPGRSVLSERTDRSGWGDWLDWLWYADDLAGFVLGLVVLVAVVSLVGGVVAIAGLIAQAEVLLAEVLLDVLLVSALNKRLHQLEPEWWLHGALRQTVWPVLATMGFLMATGLLMAHFVPGAQTVGEVWRYWLGPQ